MHLNKLRDIKRIKGEHFKFSSLAGEDSSDEDDSASSATGPRNAKSLSEDTVGVKASSLNVSRSYRVCELHHPFCPVTGNVHTLLKETTIMAFAVILVKVLGLIALDGPFR